MTARRNPSVKREAITKNQLIVQLPCGPDVDLDRLFNVEETLLQAFAQNKFATVDGHDIGEGRFNIFIFPRGSWAPVLDRVVAFLKLRGMLDEAIIAKFLGKSQRYVVVWPEDFSGTFSL